jgi:predicted PurR-regulated permease PerM
MNTSRRSDILFFFACVVALLVAYYLRSALLLIYVSILFAIVLTPAVRFVQRLSIGRWHPGKGLAIMMLLLLVLIVLAVFLTAVLPPIVRDAHQFATDWPTRAPRIMEKIENIPLLDRLDFEDVQQQMTALAGKIPKLVTGIAGGLLGIFTWLILTIYFVLDGRRATEWGLSLLPKETALRMRPLLSHARDRVRRWMLGQLLLMLILGALSALVYNLLGIRYATALAVFTGLANIVPVIGPAISVLLTSLSAAFDSWVKVVAVLGFYAAYQQLENGFLTPRIMKTTVDLPALAIVVALLIGGEIAGLLGALVAVPSAALIAVFVDEFLVAPEPEPSAAQSQLPVRR